MHHIGTRANNFTAHTGAVNTSRNKKKINAINLRDCVHTHLSKIFINFNEQNELYRKEIGKGKKTTFSVVVVFLSNFTNDPVAYYFNLFFSFFLRIYLGKHSAKVIFQNDKLIKFAINLVISISTWRSTKWPFNSRIKSLQNDILYGRGVADNLHLHEAVLHATSSLFARIT